MENRNLTLNGREFHLSVQHYEHTNRIYPHSHDFYEIVFVDSGFSMHKVFNDISLLLSGDIFIIPPGVTHEYWRSTNNSVYNCLFYPKILGDDIYELSSLPMLDMLFLKDAGTETKWNKIHLKPDDRYEILTLLKRMSYENEQKQLGWKIRLKASLMDLLVYLSRTWSCGGVSFDNYFSGNSMIPYKILNALEMSLNNTMTVEDMARASGYSTEYFSRAFKKLSGMSPSAYIISMKIAAAAQLLRDRKFSVSRVAELQGFDDVNYFSRLFKKETGKTPTEFRSMV